MGVCISPQRSSFSQFVPVHTFALLFPRIDRKPIVSGFELVPAHDLCNVMYSSAGRSLSGGAFSAACVHAPLVRNWMDNYTLSPLTATKGCLISSFSKKLRWWPSVSGWEGTYETPFISIHSLRLGVHPIEICGNASSPGCPPTNQTHKGGSGRQGRQIRHRVAVCSGKFRTSSWLWLVALAHSYQLYNYSEAPPSL